MDGHALSEEFTKGLWKENPVFRQLLGMCPTLAVTVAALNGVAMGLAVTFVLVASGIVISALRSLIPREVRIATFTIIIATFVTVADMALKAYWPDMSKSLGPYVPLIVVNCIILGRQEAFTSRNPILPSIMDTLGMGIGFTCTLVVLATVREILGSGFVFGESPLQITLLRTIENGGWFRPWVVMILPAGAFLTLGLMLMMINFFTARRRSR